MTDYYLSKSFFPNLRSIDLSDNNLTDLESFIYYARNVFYARSESRIALGPRGQLFGPWIPGYGISLTPSVKDYVVSVKDGPWMLNKLSKVRRRQIFDKSFNIHGPSFIETTYSLTGMGRRSM